MVAQLEHARCKPAGDAARREQIRALLMKARARIDPAQVGIRRAGRLRTPGLRREDVAMLAGMSVKWYTWLEQGRELNFSADVLERVASVLRLSPAERTYLRVLTRRVTSRLLRDDLPTENVRRMVRFMPVPIVVMNRRWDILVWNELTARVFRDYSRIALEQRNLLRIVLTDKRYQSDAQFFEETARKLLRQFRIDFGQFAGDERFEALVADLKTIVPGFDRLWREVEICESLRGITLVEHGELGNLIFDRHSYVPEEQVFHRVLIFTPHDPATARVLDRIRPRAREPDEAVLRAVPRVPHDGLMVRHPGRV